MGWGQVQRHAAWGANACKVANVQVKRKKCDASQQRIEPATAGPAKCNTKKMQGYIKQITED
eukprot:1158850-Pelagomonas_calceolata.AAC.2